LAAQLVVRLLQSFPMLQVLKGRAQLVGHDDREIQMSTLEQPAIRRAMTLDGPTTTRGTRNRHTNPAARRRRRVEGVGRRVRLLHEQSLVLLDGQAGQQMLIICLAEAAGAT